MVKFLIYILLRGRKEYFDIVKFKGKNYKISITEFVPAEKWVDEMEKALHEAEPGIK